MTPTEVAISTSRGLQLCILIVGGASPVDGLIYNLFTVAEYTENMAAAPIASGSVDRSHYVRPRIVISLKRRLLYMLIAALSMATLTYILFVTIKPAISVGALTFAVLLIKEAVKTDFRHSAQ